MAQSSSIYNLPFERVMALRQIRRSAEQRNDLPMQSKLLGKYPELFEATIWDEINVAYQQAQRIITYDFGPEISFEQYRKRVKRSKN